MKIFNFFLVVVLVLSSIQSIYFSFVCFKGLKMVEPRKHGSIVRKIKVSDKRESLFRAGQIFLGFLFLGSGCGMILFIPKLLSLYQILDFIFPFQIATMIIAWIGLLGSVFILLFRGIAFIINYIKSKH